MSGSCLKEVVFKDSNNANSFYVKQDGVAMDLSAATRFLLTIPSIPLEIDTDTDATAITGDAAGLVTLDINDASVTEGEYYARLRAFDPQHPIGQILIHEDATPNDRLILSFRDTN